jgi:hypothetical protein
MAKLLKQAATHLGAGKFSIMRMIGASQPPAAPERTSIAEGAARPFEGLDTTGDTPQALRAELEALRALLEEMRSERSHGTALRASS